MLLTTSMPVTTEGRLGCLEGMPTISLVRTRP